MSEIVSHAYRFVPDWERVPAGVRHKDVPDVAVDSRDNVYLLTRMDPQVLVYDSAGDHLATWGRDVLSERPHGITIGPDDTIYIVDEGRHCVDVFSTEGLRLRGIGPAQISSDTGADGSLPDVFDRIASIRRGAGPYNRPTKLAVAPNGDLYVTDGYGNARVHRFDPSGELVGSWGEPGAGPGQFHLPHSLAVAPDGSVLVCDRENDRVQVLSPLGELVDEWTDFHRPAGICIRGGLVYICELPWRRGYRTWRNGVVESEQSGRVSVLDLEGRELARWAGQDSGVPYGFSAPHGICVDSAGDIYVAEVTWTDGGKRGIYPPDCHSLVKLARAA